MSPNETIDLIEEIEELIAREHAALMAGDLDAVARMAETKASLAGRLTDTPVTDADALKRMRASADRNQGLLDGALAGIRDVADRMAALRQVRRGLDTYDSFGRRTHTATRAEPGFEKRA